MMKQKYLHILVALFAFCANTIYAQNDCPAVNAPIVESFDSYGYGINVLPTCWSRITNFDDDNNKPQISNGANNSAPCALRMYCGSNSTGGHYAIAFTPEIVEDINTLHVRLKIRGYSGAKLELGVSSDTTNASFTPIDTLTISATNVWEEHLVSLSSYSGSGHRIAIRMYRSLQPGNGMVVFVDDMNIEPCGLWNLSCQRRSMNDFWLTWDTVSNPIVNVEYGTEGFQSGTGTVLSNVTSPLNITGLTPATTYEFRFSTICNGGSPTPAGIITNTTLGGDTLTFNYCEDFESNGSSLPSGWRTPTSSVSVSTSSPYSGSRGLRFYGSNKIAVLPPLGPSQSASQFSMQLKARSYYAGAMIEVGVMDYPETDSSFVPVDTVWTSTSWNSYTFDLSSYTGNGRFIALRSFDPSNYYVYADNLQLGPCLVSGVLRTNITSHSVELQWDTVTNAFHGDSVVVEYGLSGFAAGTGTIITVPVSGNAVQTSGGRQRIVVDGLESDANYQFIVRGECQQAQVQCDMERLSAHTLAQDIVLPYCVDFEQYDSYTFPTDWSRPRRYSDCPQIYSYYSHSGSMSMQMYAYGSSMTDHSTFVLPLMEVDSVQGLQVSFWGYGNCYYGSWVEVGVMHNADDEATFIAVDTFYLVNYEWTRYVSDFSSYSDTGRYIAFRYFTNAYNYNGYIDDIEVSACAVTDVQHRSETSHGVTIEWERSGAAYNGAILEFGPHGFTPGAGTAVTLDANTTSITLDTLQSGTIYDYRLSALCSGQAGYCSLYPESFTTLDEPFVATVCETFDNPSSNGLPAGWTATLKEGSYPYLGSGQLYMSSYHYGEQTSMVVLPLLEESDLSGLTLRIRAYLYSDKALVVGMMTNPLDTSTFVPIDSIHSQYATWTDYGVNLSSYSGSGRHIALWFKYNGWYDNAYIDYLTIERCGVSNVRSYSPTTSTVMIGWEQNASTDHVTLSYRRSDLPADSTHTIDNAVSPLQLQNLTANATYYYNLEPHCTGSSRSCTVVDYTFSTLATDLQDGWCDDGTYNRNLYVYPSDSIIEVLPCVTDTLSRLLLSFDIRSQSTSNPEQSMLIVGVCTLPYDFSTFVPIDTVRPSYNWRTVSVSFSGYSGEGRHIAFLYKDNYYRTTLIQNLLLSRCKANSLEADMVTDHSLRLLWNLQPTSSAGAWLSYAPTDAYDDGEKQYFSGNSAVIGSLVPATTYRFHIWADCQDTSLLCQASVIEVTTLAEPMTIPYCYGFENEYSDALPVGWNRPYGVTWPRAYNSGQYAHTGSMSLEMYGYYYYDGRTTSMAVMPMLDPDSVDDISSLYVDGWMYANGMNQYLEVGVMVNPADSATFIPVDTVRASGHRHFKVALSSYTGTGRYVAFRVGSDYNNSGYIYLDDINLRQCVVTNAASRRPTQTSIDIVWTAPASTHGVYVEYAEVNGSGGTFETGNGTTLYITQSPYTIGDLTPATYYAFHIYPDCGDGNDGCNYESVVAQTLHPSVEIPYCDNFDSYEINDYPDNWRRISTYDSTNNPIITNNYSHSTNKSSFFKAYDTLYSLVTLPQIDMGNTCTVVDTIYAIFWTRFSSSWDAGRIIAGKITDLYDASTFVPCDTIRATNGNTWEPQTVAFTSFNTESEYLAFKLISTNGYYTECYIDDICLEKCVATEVTVGDITQNSVTITWNSFSVDSLVCEYGPEGFVAGTGTQIVITTSPYVIDGLVDGTQYQFVFASVCGCEQYGEALLPGAGSSGWNYWGGYGWGWGYGGNGWGWGWWTGRNWWETPGDGPQVTPPVVPVATQAANLVVPYCEGFESFDTLPFPASWRRISGSSASFPMVNTDNHRTGAGSLDFYTASGTTCIASLPPCDSGSVSEMVMTLSAYSSHSYAVGSNVFVVGVMDDPDVLSTFTPVDTLRLTGTSAWQRFAVDFASYSGDGRYIALRFSPQWQAYHWYVDDLSVSRCAISNVTTVYNPNSGLLVQWNTMHTPDSVVILYGHQGFMGNGDSYGRVARNGHAASGSYSLESISPSYSYDIYVYAKCDDTSILCTFDKFSINTRISLPYCEDFSGYPYNGYPDYWRTRKSPQYNTPRVDTLSDGSHLFFMEAGTGDNYSLVSLPPLEPGQTLDGKRLNIRMRSSSTYASLQFGVLTDTNNLSSFVPMATLVNSTANTTEEFSVQLTGYTGPANILAIRASSTSGTRSVWIDRMIFSNDFYPMGIIDSERGYAVRELVWDSGAYYTVEYGWNSNTQTLSSDSCHVTLDGLEPGRDYEVYFTSPGGERFCYPYRFTTLSPTELPYCDNFDSYFRYACPAGWRQLNDGSYSCNGYDGVRPRVWDAGVNYSYCLDFYNTCMQIFVMPEFDVDNVSDIGLAFDAYCYGIDDMMLIGVIEDPTDASTFAPVDTIRFSSTYTWEHKTASLAAYSGVGRYVALQSVIGSSRPLYVDNLIVTACPIPTVVAASATSVTIHSSLITNHSSPFYIEYGSHGFTQGNGTLVEIEDSVYTIEGLAPHTTYDFYLRCDSSKTACFVLDSVTTSGLLQLPYCADWNSGPYYQMPAGWYGIGTYSGSYPQLNSYGEMQFYNARYYTCAAIMPDIDIDSINRVEIFFDLYLDNNSYQALIVGVCDDPNDFSTFTAIDTIRSDYGSNWCNDIHVSLASYTGTGRFIAFSEYNDPASSSSRSLYIRNLRMQGCPYAEISLSSATEVTIHSSLITHHSSPFTIEYDTTGFAQGTGTFVEVEAIPFVIEGLQANKSYDFYQRCDSLTPTCFPPTTITTLSTLQLPYCEDFESVSDMPDGWLRYNTYTSGHPYVNDYSYYAHNSNRMLYFDMYGENRYYAILPDLDVDSLRHVSLSFWLRMGSPASTWLIVGVCNDPYDLSTFTPVDSIRTDASNVYELQRLSLANYCGTGRFLTFFAAGTSSYSWYYVYIDDLSIQGCPIVDITLSDATAVTINGERRTENGEWRTENNPFYVEYGTTNFTQGTGTMVQIDSLPFVIDGLQPNTAYDFYQRCDVSMPACTAPVTITTSSSVDIPYCETFDYSGQSNQMPVGWRRYNTYSYSTSPYVSSSSQLYMYAGSSDICYSVLPVIDSLPVNSLSITFDLQCSASSYSGLIVGIMDDPDDIGTFTSIDTLRNSNESLIQRHVSFASYQGSGRFIALRHLSTSSNRSIYVDNLMVEPCDLPAGIRATLYGNNIVRITADSSHVPLHNPFYVEYGTTNFTLGNGTRLLCNSLPLDIQLNNYTTYDFYFLCDTALPTCRVAQTIETAGDPLELSYCENFDATSPSSLPTGWRALCSSSSYNPSSYVRVTNGSAHTVNRKLQMNTSTGTSYFAVLPEMAVDSLSQLAVSFYMRSTYNSSVTVGVLSDPADYTSFLPVATFTGGSEWQRFLFALEGVHRDARYLAFRSNPGTSSGTVYIDDVFIDSCGVHGFIVGQTESDHITLSWSKVGNPDITIEYGAVGFQRGTGTIVHPTSSPYTVANLDALTSYMFYFDAACDPAATGFCNLNYHDSVSRFTPAGGTGCIDPTNLTADYTTCFYGTYGNPTQHIGIVDYGSSDVRSRHTVHYDVNATDPRTGGLLRVVPEGADASVRLGNWNSGGQGNAEAESVVYSLYVDTTAFDLLILKYAAVLQDPDHAIEDQPRFSLQLLDDSLQLLDTVCAAANFVANSSLGWNQAPNMVLWKDWTTVGVDVSAYGGQTVNIRLTTYDCNEGNHYGYAYFTLGCMMKNMRSELCGDVDSNRFYAPSGFAYRWYNESDVNVTLSNEQSIGVPTDNTTYYCDCSFVDNSDCSFTLSAFAGTRYPLADFTYTVEQRDCRYYVSFTNTSTISLDGSDTLVTGEPCESALWDFGNGETSESYNASTVYNSAGSYTVTLISGIASDSCTHQKEIVLNLQHDSSSVAVVAPDAICMGDSVTLTVNGLTDSIQYETLHWFSPQVHINAFLDSCDNDTTVSLQPLLAQPTTDDTVYLFQFSILNSSGCTDTFSHPVVIHPVYLFHDTVAICQNQLPYTWHDTTFTETDLDDVTSCFTFSNSSIYNCDSINNLTLTVHPVYNIPDTEAICQSQLPYTWQDTTLNETEVGDITDSYSALFTFSASSSENCDSINTLSLTVYPVYHFRDTVTICQDQLPYTWQDTTITESALGNVTGSFSTLLTYTASSTNLCDSIHTLLFAVNPVYNLYDTTVIVQNQLPYSWHDTTITVVNLELGSGVGSALLSFADLSSLGCDSTQNLVLLVHLNDTVSVSDTLCASVLPYTWNGVSFDLSIDTAHQNDDGSLSIDHVATLQTVNGADSVVIMSLYLVSTTYGTYYDTIVENDLPYIFYYGADSVAFDTLPNHNSPFFDFNQQLTTLNYSDCDSIIDYNLTVFANVQAVIDSSICASSLPFTWHDSTIAEDDFSSDTVFTLQYSTHTTYGADSLVTLNVTVHSVYDFYDTTVIVQNQLPFTWHDTTVTESDIHIAGLSNGQTFSTLLTYSTLSSFNCDSTQNFALLVHLNDTVSVSDTLCASVLPYTWNGVSFSVLDSVRHYDDGSMGIDHEATLTKDNGADSVVRMSLYLISTTYSTYYDTIVENNLPYIFHYDTDSVAFDTLPNHSDLFFDFNQQLTTINIAGCDSIINYNLTVFANVQTTLDTSLCASSLPFTWHDSTIAQVNLATDTVFNLQYLTYNSSGADSLVILNVTVHPLYDLRDTVVSCDNQPPYVWRDSTITVPAFVAADTTLDVQILASSAYGCDSIMRLNLTVGKSYAFYDTVVLCQSELPYTWHDTVINDNVMTESGAGNPYSTFITLPIFTIHSCDSVYHLSLTVNPTYLFPDTVVICKSQLPYTWYDSTITETPDDITTLLTYSTLSSLNCDSTYTRLLAVYDTTYASVYDTIVENQLPYTFLDSVFSSTHFAGQTSSFATLNSQFTIINSHGCDSIVDYTLTLYRNDTVSVSQTICSDALPFTWRCGNDSVVIGETVVTHALDTTFNAQLTISTVHGADSVVNLTLTVRPSYIYNDTTEICSNRLPYTWCDTTFNLFMGTIAARGYFTRHYQTAAHCDSTRTLLLLVYGSYNTVDRQESCSPYEWIDGVTYSEDTYGPQVTLESEHGCDSVVTLDFHISDPAVTLLTDSFCVSDTYSWRGRTITDGGIYYDSLLTVEGCDSIITLTLTRLELPNVAVDVESDCEMRLYGLTATSDVRYLHWSCSTGGWSPDWGPQTSSQVWVKPPMPSTTFTVTADYLESGICPNAATVILSPMRVPTARMKVSPEQLGNDDDHFYALDQSLSADSREWFINDDSYGDDVRIECYPAEGLDSVIVTLVAVSDQCTDTTVQIVHIYRNSVFAPNAFTPDENTNRYFQLFLRGVIEYELFIYNRAGILLFHSTDPDEHWDGTFKGKPLPQASYVWVLRYTTEEKPRQPQSMKGSVLLIR